MRYVALAALLGGCAPAYPEKPGQAQALAAVLSVYGPSDCSPFDVEWVEVPECYSVGGLPGVIVAGRCSGDATYPDRHLSRIVWLGSFWESAFAHGHLHGHQACRGIFDYEHAHPEWDTLEPAAKAELKRGDTK